MREIKFRAWDKEYFRFHRIESIEFLDGEIENVIIQNYMPIHISKIELMQYTGLKDKNDIEIYEGDIIDGGVCFSRDVFGEIMYRHLSVVSFKDGCFVRTGLKHNTKSVNLQINIIEFEVIGNIYQNPELLDSLKD